MMDTVDDMGLFDGICLKNQICFSLYVCAKEFVRLYRQPLEELDLTYTQYVVMTALWENGSMTVCELGKRIYLDSGTLTPLLKRMEKRGLIRRVRPVDNGRVLQLILDIPCNQFGGQAPGTDDEIHEFCTLHFNTTFPQMKKADVNGANELPLYTYLKSEKGFEGFDEHPFKELLEKMFASVDPDWADKPDIKWNFTKFFIDREGNVVARFEPTADIKDVEECIKSLL